MKMPRLYDELRDDRIVQFHGDEAGGTKPVRGQSCITRTSPRYIPMAFVLRTALRRYLAASWHLHLAKRQIKYDQRALTGWDED